LNPGLALYLE